MRRTDGCSPSSFWTIDVYSIWLFYFDSQYFAWHTFPTTSTWRRRCLHAYVSICGCESIDLERSAVIRTSGTATFVKCLFGTSGTEFLNHDTQCTYNLYKKNQMMLPLDTQTWQRAHASSSIKFEESMEPVWQRSETVWNRSGAVWNEVWNGPGSECTNWAAGKTSLLASRPKQDSCSKQLDSL